MLSIKAKALISAIVITVTCGSFVAFIKLQPESNLCPKADYLEDCEAITYEKHWEDYKQSKWY